MSLLGLMVLGAPAHHHLHRPPPGRGRPHGPHGPHGPHDPHGPHGPPGPHGPHGPGGGHRGPGRRPAPRPPWAPHPGGDCDCDYDYDYDADYADYAAADYASPDDEPGKPGVPPALARCGAAARALESGCEDAFVRVARGARRGDIAPEDAAAAFESVARGCEAKLEALAAKCADAFAVSFDAAETGLVANANDDDATKKACDAAAAAMEMPCVDEPAGAMQALEAGKMSAETAARTLGESAVSCADAAAAAETACAL